MTMPDRTTLPSGSVTCRDVIEFLMAYLDGDLTPEQRRVFERHLSVCPSCVNYMNSYKDAVRMGKQAMLDLDEPASGTVPEGLIKAIRAARSKPTP